MPPPDGRRTSLTRKLLAAYLPLVSLSVLVLFAAIEFASYRTQVNELERGLTELVELQSPAFTSAAWEYNDEQLDVLLGDLQRTPHFRGAVVHDTLGEVLARAGDVDGAEPALLREIALIYETEHVREEVGRLAVAFHRDRIHADLRRRLLTDALVLVVLVLTLIGVTILAARRVVLRPITMLRRRVLRIADGADDESVEDVRTGDELEELAGAFTTMQRKVEERGVALTKSRDAVIFALAKLAESRDGDTGQHLERICLYVEMLARDMAADDPALDERWVRTMTMTAALHDIGKVGVPDAVLLKPGKLTDEEHETIRRHTTIGGDTLLALKQSWGDDTFLVTAMEIAFAHHERWDGRGYPFGLAGEAIPLPGRITAVADVYDALRSPRVYKSGMSHEEARTLIVEAAGTQFDPSVVETFLRVEGDFRRVAAEMMSDARPGQ